MSLIAACTYDVLCVCVTANVLHQVSREMKWLTVALVYRSGIKPLSWPSIQWGDSVCLVESVLN